MLASGGRGMRPLAFARVCWGDECADIWGFLCVCVCVDVMRAGIGGHCMGPFACWGMSVLALGVVVSV